MGIFEVQRRKKRDVSRLCAIAVCTAHKIVKDVALERGDGNVVKPSLPGHAATYKRRHQRLRNIYGSWNICRECDPDPSVRRAFQSFRVGSAHPGSGGIVPFNAYSRSDIASLYVFGAYPARHKVTFTKIQFEFLERKTISILRFVSVDETVRTVETLSMLNRKYRFGPLPSFFSGFKRRICDQLGRNGRSNRQAEKRNRPQQNSAYCRPRPSYFLPISFTIFFYFSHFLPFTALARKSSGPFSRGEHSLLAIVFGCGATRRGKRNGHACG